MSGRIELSTVDPAVAAIIEKFTRFNNKVPEETRNDLKEIEQLDEVYRTQQNELYEIKIEYLANMEKLSGQQKVVAFQKVKDEYDKMTAIGAKKVAIAKRMRERHERVLEEFAREERRFMENWPQSKRPVHRELCELPPPPAEPATSAPKRAVLEPPKKAKRGRKRKNEETLTEDVENDDGDTRSYCWCQMERVETPMVCCENPSCKYEWFHFECIGMTNPPAGDWFCGIECQKKAMVAKRKQKFDEREAAVEETETARKRK